MATASGVPPDLAIDSAMEVTARTLASAVVASATPPRERATGRPPIGHTREWHQGALADGGAIEVDAAHAGLRRERDEMGVHRRHLAAADAVLLLGEDDDRAAFRRFVGERGELRRIGELALRYARQRDELGGLTVAERDRAGLVEQQGVDVARRLDRPAGHREHVEANEPVHAGDADRREQPADGGRDQGHEQRDEHEHAERAPGIGREAGNGGDGEDEDDRHAGEQDVERDLVRRLLPLRALDQRDHPVEERRAGCAVMRTLIQSESTCVPPVTAERSPPLSRITGADSPVIAASSTEATPSITSPSPG